MFKLDNLAAPPIDPTTAVPVMLKVIMLEQAAIESGIQVDSILAANTAVGKHGKLQWKIHLHSKARSMTMRIQRENRQVQSGRVFTSHESLSAIGGGSWWPIGKV